jgi:hypothetical protein
LYHQIIQPARANALMASICGVDVDMGTFGLPKAKDFVRTVMGELPVKTPKETKGCSINATMTDGVEVLIPKAILDRRKLVIRESCLDYDALMDVLPTASAMDDALDSSLPADPHACRVWLARVIRALPTASDMETSNGVA